jgi:hypothetical protein
LATGLVCSFEQLLSGFVVAGSVEQCSENLLKRVHQGLSSVGRLTMKRLKLNAQRIRVNPNFAKRNLCKTCINLTSMHITGSNI